MLRGDQYLSSGSTERHTQPKGTMPSKSLTVAALAGSALMIGSSANALAANLRHAEPVKLADAKREPSMLRLLKADRSVTVTRQCARGTYFADTSAYRWNGTALMGQRWNKARDRTFWLDGQAGGRVTFDGIKFHNGTSMDVLIAGWCG